ncbi:hypothetical protein BD410DRAFT_825955 [Rickenella mellea]|uniref:Uncharacterized protein n=1 Tax=Rickenella mellea TaxID=50990 RepID=A0A4Y7QG18_9AGAM|nr:hypothetical protein BD410DRAFT_825955 [Rickenella mellea]
MADISTIPLSPVKDDAETLQIFEEHEIKHEILHKIWELHKEDERHNLNEIRKLEHVKFYKPLAYRTQEVPYGVNYFGKILLDEKGDTIHVRLFKPAQGEPVKFHAIHNRPTQDGGALFTKDDEVAYFEY